MLLDQAPALGAIMGSLQPGGSGIGPAQTYQIMQWRYGSVDFETADGRGTTFRLRLPVIETAPELKENKEKEVTTQGNHRSSSSPHAETYLRRYNKQSRF